MVAEAPPPTESTVVEGLFKLAVTTRRPFCARGGLLLLPVDEVVVVVVVAVDAPKLAERAGRGMGRSPAEVVVRPP
jgi:hypothetical protein